MSDYTFQPYPKKKRKSKRRSKPRSKSRQALERELWRVFSLYIRKRDGRCMVGTSFSGYLCSGPLQAGHVIGRRKLATKYDEKNVFGQCRRHNWIHNRTPETYINWFVKRFGQQEFSSLVERSQRPQKALGREELEKLIKEYTKKLEAL